MFHEAEALLEELFDAQQTFSPNDGKIESMATGEDKLLAKRTG